MVGRTARWIGSGSPMDGGGIMPKAREGGWKATGARAGVVEHC